MTEAGEVSHWLTELVALAGDLSSIPSTHMVANNNYLHSSSEI